MFAKVRMFVEEDIWRVRAKGLPPLKAAIVSQLTGRRPAWPTLAP